eukprot:4306820-Pyramimonas_sp.AAC.1
MDHCDNHRVGLELTCGNLHSEVTTLIYLLCISCTTEKYEDTLALLAEQGWQPILITMILGTLGEITIDIEETLSENLGVRGQSLMKLLVALHGKALK